MRRSVSSSGDVGTVDGRGSLGHSRISEQWADDGEHYVIGRHGMRAIATRLRGRRVSFLETPEVFMVPDQMSTYGSGVRAFDIWLDGTINVHESVVS